MGTAWGAFLASKIRVQQKYLSINISRFVGGKRLRFGMNVIYILGYV